jgi:hypothetical protein
MADNEETDLPEDGTVSEDVSFDETAGGEATAAAISISTTLVKQARSRPAIAAAMSCWRKKTPPR